jgi:A/G-specific adenine glycosylase
VPDPGAGAAGRADEAVERLLGWFRREGEDLPWRRTRDRYAILVAEAQLQATPVARVLPYYARFMRRWPTAAALAAASLGDVLAAWHGLGYPRRARNLHAAAARVASDGWPELERLQELPGVGPYTSSALRCFADEEDVLPVDVNVARVLARRFPGGWPGTPPGAAWAVGQALMELGRRACTARAPRCDAGCPLREGCPSADLGTALARTPPRRRQGPYAGSLRQRRGRLLGALAREGRARRADDPEAADSLVAEGLARRRGALLLPMGAGPASARGAPGR